MLRAVKMSGRRGAGRVGVSTEKIGVLFVHTATQPPLGADTWVQSQIIAGLDKNRVDVHVACAFGSDTEPTPTYAAMRSIPNIRIVAVNLGRERRGSKVARLSRAALDAVAASASIARLAVYVRRNDIRIIHTTDRPRDAAACVVLRSLTGAHSIVHAHVGFDAAWMSGTLQWAIRRADALIAVSEFVASTLVDSGHDANRVHVVLNAIDLSRWSPGVGRDVIRREFGFEDDDVVLITVCRLFPAKGPTELIQALALVLKRRVDVHLLIVGREMQPGYVAELVELARNLGIHEQVVLTGQRQDVPALMAAADIYAMPSFAEPFGLVYLEAMAMQRPVVALKSGGTPEVVEDGLDGLLSDPGDVRQFADNLIALADDRDRRTRIGNHARHRVEHYFTIERMARDTEAVYERVLARRRLPNGSRPVGVTGRFRAARR